MYLWGSYNNDFARAPDSSKNVEGEDKDLPWFLDHVIEDLRLIIMRQMKLSFDQKTASNAISYEFSSFVYFSKPELQVVGG